MRMWMCKVGLHPKWAYKPLMLLGLGDQVGWLCSYCGKRKGFK